MRNRVAACARPALALLALALASCAGPAGPAPIATGHGCAACGMTISDLRFACERKVYRTWRQYDAIECLLSDSTASGPAWLADYDTRGLHSADSLWVVRGDLPSPMGGGYAAFLDHASATDVAAARHGRLGRLAEFAAGGAGPTP